MSAALRPLAPCDLARAAEIERHTFSDPWSPAAFRDALAQAHIHTLGAFEPAQRLVGYVLGSVVADAGEILNIAVDPGERGRGIGTALLDAMLDRLGRSGALAVFLEVRCSNEAAIRLYQRSGFAVLGTRPDYYRHPMEDALTMGRVRGQGTHKNDEEPRDFG